MSGFYCNHCGALIVDSSIGYVTGCTHYPLKKKRATVEKKGEVTRSFVFDNTKGRIIRQ